MSTLTRSVQAGTQAPLQLEGVRLEIGGLTVTPDASFRCPKGTTTVIVGPNGSGKTTILNAVAGFIRPIKGRILYYGKELTHVTPRYIARAGYGVARSFQTPFVVEELSVIENVLLGRRDPAESFVGILRGVAKGQPLESPWHAEAVGVLRSLRLAEKVRRPAAELSAGERRRLCLARTVFSGAQILLLDEPLANLDQDSKGFVVSWLRRLAEDGRVLVIVEHELVWLQTIANQTVHVRLGEPSTILRRAK